MHGLCFPRNAFTSAVQLCRLLIVCDAIAMKPHGPHCLRALI